MDSKVGENLPLLWIHYFPSPVFPAGSVYSLFYAQWSNKVLSIQKKKTIKRKLVKYSYVLPNNI